MNNQDCVRDLLLFFGNTLTISPTGKKPRPVKLRRILSEPPLDRYSSDEIYTAAQYLVEKALIMLSAPLPVDVASTSPRWYVVSSITAKGKDYLEAVRNDSLWPKLRKSLGRVFEATIPEIVSAAATLGVQLFVG